MANFKDLTITAAAANFTVVAVDISNADIRIKLAGAGGLPYNNASGQLIGTAIVAGVTPISGIPLLSAGNVWSGSNTFTFAQLSNAGWIARTDVSTSGGYFLVGTTGDLASFRALGTDAASYAPDAVAGDAIIQTETEFKTLHIGCGIGQYAPLQVAYDTGVPVAYANGNFKLKRVGYGIYIKEGANATMGTLTLNGATEVTVSTTKVTANSRIFLTVQAPGGTPAGIAYVSSRSAGASFGVKGIASDTSTVAWMIVEPTA